MTRIIEGHSIDYRHIIDSLIRKPGAFFNYRYHDALFPSKTFRSVYDQLMQLYPSKGHKEYMKILRLAKIYGEMQVTFALELLANSAKTANSDNILPLLGNHTKVAYNVVVAKPDLTAYDNLHSFRASIIEEAQVTIEREAA